MTCKPAPGLRIALVSLIASLVLMQACSVRRTPTTDSGKDAQKSDASKPAATPDTQPKDAQSVEDRTLVAVSKAIRTSHLSALPDQCLAYGFDQNSSGDAYIVEVRENHRHAGCGGDPQSEPRLFTVKVDKHTQAMSSDQGSPGKFHPVG